MSTFCLDMSSVGFPTEFNGSPDVLEGGARTLRDTAKQLGDAARNIQRLTEQGNEMESEAYGALADRSSAVYTTMIDAATRYRMMATAAQNFASVLREEQGNAVRLMDEVGDAQRAQSSAQSLYQEARISARDLDPAAQQRALELHSQGTRAMISANASLSAAKQQLQAAADRIHQANVKASNEVKTAMEVSGLDDSLWDKIVYLGEKISEVAFAVGKWIWDNIDTICLVLQVVALVLQFIPGIGNVAGGLLMGIGYALTVAKTISFAKKTWEITDDALEGRYAEVGAGVLKLGLSFAIGKGISALGKTGLVKKLTGSAANKIFGHGSSSSPGVINQTPVGRAIHDLGERFGGPTFPAGTPLPTNFVSQHIERTTSAIQDGLTDVAVFGAKKLVDQITTSVVDSAFSKPTQAKTYCLVTSGTTVLPGGGGGGGGF